MKTHYQTATVFGATGFVGRHVVRGLARKGIRVKVATRTPQKAYFLKVSGTVGQIVPFTCNLNDPESVKLAVSGSDFVINCIGILYERRKSTFQKIHVDIPTSIAQACVQTGAKRLVHISSLGCEKGSSKYSKTKYEGEKAIIQTFPHATILRPSVIFGKDDSFFNKFAELSRYLPFLPLIGGGKTKFQPVFVGDVADAVIASLDESSRGKLIDPRGHIYELGGPDVLNFKEIYETLFRYTLRRRYLVHLPWPVAKIQGSFLSLFPNPLLTADQVESLKIDNVVNSNSLGFADLGVIPKSLDLILPDYLENYRSGGRFSQNKVRV